MRRRCIRSLCAAATRTSSSSASVWEVFSTDTLQADVRKCTTPQDVQPQEDKQQQQVEDKEEDKEEKQPLQEDIKKALGEKTSTSARQQGDNKPSAAQQDQAASLPLQQPLHVSSGALADGFWTIYRRRSLRKRSVNSGAAVPHGMEQRAQQQQQQQHGAASRAIGSRFASLSCAKRTTSLTSSRAHQPGATNNDHKPKGHQ